MESSAFADTKACGGYRVVVSLPQSLTIERFKRRDLYKRDWDEIKRGRMEAAEGREINQGSLAGKRGHSKRGQPPSFGPCNVER